MVKTRHSCSANRWGCLREEMGKAMTLTLKVFVNSTKPGICSFAKEYIKGGRQLVATSASASWIFLAIVWAKASMRTASWRGLPGHSGTALASVPYSTLTWHTCNTAHVQVNAASMMLLPAVVCICTKQAVCSLRHFINTGFGFTAGSAQLAQSRHGNVIANSGLPAT